MSVLGERIARAAGELLDGAQELAWPTRCLGCELPGELLCDECRAELPWIAQRWACPVCGAPFGWLTCTECERDWETRCCICALTFRGTAARMATALKDAHELRLAPVMAAAMEVALEEASAWDAPDDDPRFMADDLDALAFVPATPEAYPTCSFARGVLTSVPLAGKSVRRTCAAPCGPPRTCRASGSFSPTTW